MQSEWISLQLAFQANNPLDRELKRAGESFKAFSKKNEKAFREVWKAIELLQRENAGLKRELSSQKRAEAGDPSNGPFTRGLAEALKEDQEEQLLFREKAEKKFSWIKQELDYHHHVIHKHHHGSNRRPYTNAYPKFTASLSKPVFFLS